MSGHAPDCTLILASKEASDARGVVTLPVLTARGEWHGLQASAATWRGIADALAVHGIVAGPPSPESGARRPIKKAGKPRSPRHALYVALHDEHLRTGTSVSELARREGIAIGTLHGAFARIETWQTQQAEAALDRARLAADAGLRPVVAKPSGRIL